MKTLLPNPKTTAKKSLRFTPTALAKLLYLRDAGPTEIGGFGIAAADDLLLVTDIRLVDQECSVVHVAFDDASVADYFDAQVDAGRSPQEFARLWIHTHPGNSAQPSSTDEETFSRVFGGADWALMFILARGGQTYARLRFHVGPGADVLLPVEVDYRQPFAGSDGPAWQEEYEAHVQIPPPPKQVVATRRSALFGDEEPLDELRTVEPPLGWYEDWDDYTRYYDSPEETKNGTIRDF